MDMETEINLMRPSCYTCSSIDVSCQDCGFDWDECECRDVLTGEGFYVCKVCQKPALDWVVDSAVADKVNCMACGTEICAANFYDWPDVPSRNAVCDDCYVTDSIGAAISETQGPCAHDRIHLCMECGIYRLSTNSKWKIVEDIVDEIKQLKCECNPAKTYSCDTCGVWRNKITDPWKKVVDGGTTTVPSSKVTTSSTYSTGSTYAYVGKCRHYGEPLTYPSGVTVYASSSNSVRPASENPDMGLYLDWVWKPAWRAEFIDWQDYGLPTNEDDAYSAIVEMYERAKKGQKIEVGCIGGHGRTGTVLACMGVIDGLQPKEAVDYVRKYYCKETIETSSQEWFVRWFSSVWNETEFSEEKPADDWWDYSYGSGYYSSGASTSTSSAPVTKTNKTNYINSHTLPQHFEQWVTGKTSCDLSSCNWSKRDFVDLSNGKFTQGCLDRCEVPMDQWSKKAIELVTQKVNESKVLNLNKIHGLKPTFIEVDGFIVPKPLAGNTQHNATLDDCNCDVCRYRRNGGLAFLTPKQTSLVSEADPHPAMIKMYVNDGKIIDMPITENFEPMPPTAINANPGDRLNDYVFVQEHGWVYDRINLAPKLEEAK